MASSSSTVVCEMYRDGYEWCSGKEKVYLVVDPDKYAYMMCEECINCSVRNLAVGTLIFEIGDDVTNRFL